MNEDTDPEGRMKRMAEWLHRWGTFLGVIVAIIGIWFASAQNNRHRRWQNYNEMNLRYSVLYENMPSEVAQDGGLSFADLPEESKRWVRQYFDLYSEEYWLYQNNLIPKEMWTERIDVGVKVNLNQYPVMIKGYLYWKENGSFNHPDDFREVVEKKIEEASSNTQ